MAVDTNFASLFEKLKVEDPYLPPTTWESIPSQNATRSHPAPSASPPSPLFNTSSVSEASLVRLALNALQGAESALISIRKLSDAFSSDPADRTYHTIPSLWHRFSSTFALGKILISIGCSGSLVFLLHKFVDYFTDLNLNEDVLGKTNGYSEHSNGDMQKKECPSYSLVNQAFAVAVRKVLDGYVCALDTLNASVRLRRSSVSAETYQHITCPTSAAHSEVTLLEVYLHSKELRTQIEALGNVCNLHNIARCFSLTSFEDLTAKAALEISKFYRGADLLTYLHTQLQVADPAHCALLKFLFLCSCEPYCRFIRSWIFKAEINDPYKEFVVEFADNLPPYLHCEAGIPKKFPLARIRDGVAVPCFLKDFLIPIVRAGQQLQVLKMLLELCNYATYKDFLPSWSGYLNNDQFYASPITFSKKYLEAVVSARNDYYGNMLQKLEGLLTKLEFKYLQVLPESVVPIVFDNTVLDNRVLDNLNSDNSAEKDEFSTLDASELSECSSLCGSEGQAEVGEDVDCPNIALVHERTYLSSLRFSISPIEVQNPAERKGLDKKESSLCEISEVKVHDYLQNSYQHKTAPDFAFMPVGFEEPNGLSLLGTQCMDSLTDECLPLGFLSNPFYNYEGTGLCERLNQCKSMHVLTPNPQSQCLHLAEEQFDCRSYVSESFSSQRWKVDNHCNFFSANPMLNKSSLFCSVRKPREEHRTAHGHLVSCFDFSTVEDPCKVSVERLAISLRHECGPQVLPCMTSPAANDKICDKSKGHHGKVNHSTDNNQASGNLPFAIKHTEDVDVARKICGGSSWQSLLGSFGCSKNEDVGDARESLFSIFEIPLDFIIEKCLLQEIMLQYKYVSKLTIKLLEEGFGLREHLLAMRRYYFMESADWADLFILSLWKHKWSVAEADRRIPEIQGFLELSVQRSSCEQDPNKDRLFVYIKENDGLSLSTSAIGIHSFNFLGLGYRVDWPVNIVLTSSSLKIYAEIFSFLMQVKLTVFSLNDTWCSLKDLLAVRSTVPEREAGHFSILMKIRQQIYHFVSTLQQYVHSQLSHVSWSKFLHSLKYKVQDMMDLETVHNAYLTDALHICFLSNEMQTVASIIESILQCAMDFRSCLTSSMLDLGLDQGNLLGETPRIKMSQVHAIKQKFDKNLIELRTCYIKSPKHGGFGLSCFWGYLNYNKYYSNIGSKVDIHAF